MKKKIISACIIIMFLTTLVIAVNSNRKTITFEDVSESNTSGTVRWQTSKNKDGSHDLYLNLKLRNFLKTENEIYETWLKDKDSGYILSLGTFTPPKTKAIKQNRPKRTKTKKISLRIRQTQINPDIYDTIIITKENVNDQNPFPNTLLLEATIPNSIGGNTIPTPWCTEQNSTDFEPVIAIMYKSVIPSLLYNHTSGIENTDGTTGVQYKTGIWGEYITGIGFGKIKHSKSWTYKEIPYQWTEINHTGTALGLDDDELSLPIPLPFNITFLDGTQKNTLRVVSNGYITFNLTTLKTGCCNGNSIPNTSKPNDFVAGYWVDLDPTSGGEIYYQTIGSPPERTFIIEFDRVVHYSDLTTPETFQIILIENT